MLSLGIWTYGLRYCLCCDRGLQDGACMEVVQSRGESGKTSCFLVGHDMLCRESTELIFADSLLRANNKKARASIPEFSHVRPASA